MDVGAVAREFGCGNPALYALLDREHAEWWKVERESWKKRRHARKMRKYMRKYRTRALAEECATDPSRWDRLTQRQQIAVMRYRNDNPNG